MTDLPEPPTSPRSPAPPGRSGSATADTAPPGSASSGSASSGSVVAAGPGAKRPPVPRLVEWPAARRPFSPRLPAGAALAGILAAALFPGRPGLNVPIVGVAVAATLFPVARRDRTSMVFGALVSALLVVPVLVDAGWLTALAISLAVPLGSYALTGGRSWIDLLGGGLALPLAAPNTVLWAGRGLAVLGRSRRRPIEPVVGAVAVAAVLLAVFGGLFATADAAFSRAVTGLLPDLAAGPLLLRILVFGCTAAVVLTGAFLAVAPPRFVRPPAASHFGRTPWVIPVAALDLLFLGFAAVQADVLLASDKDRLLRSTGLSYAEYARQGFWQLLIVTGLVLVVVAVAVRYAPLESRADRATVRTLLGLLCALTLVVVAVALRRLYLYEETYGWTRLRLWVHAFELWMGLVVVLIAVAGIRLRAAWLPRAVAMSGAAGLLALSLLNPDGFIAARNVDHFRHTGSADLSYLSGLSADAVPALDRLPEPQRSCTLRALAGALRHGDSWSGLNLSRTRARAVLRRHPIQRSPVC
ncbi:DUF4153 domain-containing protein [Actinomadura scrupuli]|uniref:DUF4153 domain-containing protein n=1 Tax=Actinomadura scrupuli TaxID=559629 RepID=UPI003D95E1C0